MLAVRTHRDPARTGKPSTIHTAPVGAILTYTTRHATQLYEGTHGGFAEGFGRFARRGALGAATGQGSRLCESMTGIRLPVEGQGVRPLHSHRAAHLAKSYPTGAE